MSPPARPGSVTVHPTGWGVGLSLLVRLGGWRACSRWCLLFCFFCFCCFFLCVGLYRIVCRASSASSGRARQQYYTAVPLSAYSSTKGKAFPPLLRLGIFSRDVLLLSYSVSSASCVSHWFYCNLVLAIGEFCFRDVVSPFSVVLFPFSFPVGPVPGGMVAFIAV